MVGDRGSISTAARGALRAGGATCEGPCVGRTFQMCCMWQLCMGELLLNPDIVNHLELNDSKYTTNFEIRVRCHLAVHANSGTDTVIDNVHEIWFHDTEQSMR